MVGLQTASQTVYRPSRPLWRLPDTCTGRDTELQTQPRACRQAVTSLHSTGDTSHKSNVLLGSIFSHTQHCARQSNFLNKYFSFYSLKSELEFFLRLYYKLFLALNTRGVRVYVMQVVSWSFELEILISRSRNIDKPLDIGQSRSEDWGLLLTSQWNW